MHLTALEKPVQTPPPPQSAPNETVSKAVPSGDSWIREIAHAYGALCCIEIQIVMKMVRTFALRRDTLQLTRSCSHRIHNVINSKKSYNVRHCNSAHPHRL